MLVGGCLCGAIRYATDGAVFHPSVCHCTMCRRASGAPLVAWFSVPRPTLRIVSGNPAWYRSSAKAERGFCPTCGTPLFFRSSLLTGEIDITTASLDDPALVPPRDQIYTSTKIPWVAGMEALPAFAAARLPAAG
jgi:hypothetical protein